jgi:precorrin-2 dehydrogenase/sirohydrochlorin ferrochelatase
LVISTFSDPFQNNRIGNLCRDRTILFNNADGEAGDVILPSVIGGKNFTIAISTKGSSPAVSRFIREHLEKTYPGLDGMIALQSEMREQLKHHEPSQARRTAILREVLSDTELWEMLIKDPSLARKQAKKRYLHE